MPFLQSLHHLLRGPSKAILKEFDRNLADPMFVDWGIGKGEEAEIDRITLPLPHISKRNDFFYGPIGNELWELRKRGGNTS
jgi:hypothetical protein